MVEGRGPASWDAEGAREGDGQTRAGGASSERAARDSATKHRTARAPTHLILVEDALVLVPAVRRRQRRERGRGDATRERAGRHSPVKECEGQGQRGAGRRGREGEGAGRRARDEAEAAEASGGCGYQRSGVDVPCQFPRLDKAARRTFADPSPHCPRGGTHGPSEEEGWRRGGGRAGEGGQREGNCGIRILPAPSWRPLLAEGVAS